jgi:hypothetical protein
MFPAQNLSGYQMYPPDIDKGVYHMQKVVTAAECVAACCDDSTSFNCTAWNFHVSSTDPTHHPLECWLTNASAPVVAKGLPVDVWVGGSKLAVHKVSQPGGGGGTAKGGGGGAIQPLSGWFYYGRTGPDTLLRELTDQSVSLLRERAARVGSLRGNGAWHARQEEAQKSLDTVFSPLPPPEATRTPPSFKVVRTLDRPSYTCELILYETRPNFWVTASLWTPKSLRARPHALAPGVLLVSGHTPDGFRSNNLNGNKTENAPGDDDYEVVQINLVARGFVVLAFDPIGQGERMQYADIPEGRANPKAPWSSGDSRAWLWGSTAQHEYIGRQLLLNGVGLMSYWLHDETLSLDLLAVGLSLLGIHFRSSLIYRHCYSGCGEHSCLMLTYMAM